MSNVPNIGQSKLKRITEILFILWGLTLPFGAKIGHFSAGYLTIYPNFILGLILLPLVLFSFPSWQRFAKGYFIFLILWVCYAMLQPKLLGTAYHDNWKFDMRSLIMQCLFAATLIGGYYTLGKEIFMKRLRQGSLYLLLVVLIAGLLEFYTGYHLRGHFTDKFFDEYTVTNIFYTPVFIYDNANDYMVYLISLSMLYFALNYREKESSIWQVATVMALCFLFAFNASSRMAMWLTVGVLCIVFLKGFWHKIVATWKVWLLPAGCAVLFLGILLWNSPLFVGPKYTKHNFTSSGEWQPLPGSLPTVGMASDDIRLALLKNSVDFIKEQPLIGIGPGEFRERHTQGQVNHSAWTVMGPHNFPMEVVTQYGVIGWIYGFIWLGLFGLSFFNFRSKKINIWALLLVPVLAGCSLMPSGFLYLDIHWLIVPIVLLINLHSVAQPAEENE